MDISSTDYLISLFVYLKQGMRQNFDAYEAQVLPLLKEYQGRLVQKIIPKEMVGESQPDEIHLVAFPSKSHFERYVNAPERKAYSPLLEKSTKRVGILEGNLLSDRT